MMQRDYAQKALAAFQAGDAHTAARGSVPNPNDLLRTKTIYLNAMQVRARYGGISDMPLWRWLHDKELGFPKPTRINRLRYWEDAN
jgi:predicted DNA-binding transcriptional regulator AlpA